MIRKRNFSAITALLTCDINNYSEEIPPNLCNDLLLVVFCSKNELLQSMWPEGAQSVTNITKRPVTAGTHFKNSIIELVKNLGSKVL